MMEGTIADDTTLSMIDIQNRCKTEIDTTGIQFCSQHKTNLLSKMTSADRPLIPDFPQLTHRRQFCKVFLESLHTTTFMINRDQ